MPSPTRRTRIARREVEPSPYPDRTSAGRERGGALPGAPLLRNRCGAAGSPRREVRGRPVVYFEINGRDAEALAAFYGELFGWRVRRRAEPNFRELDTGTARGIGGGIGECAEPEAQWLTVYVEVPDADAALRRARELGGTVLIPPLPARGGPVIAAFADPEGHVVGLVEARDE